jgi:hypothetical protein
MAWLDKRLAEHQTGTESDIAEDFGQSYSILNSDRAVDGETASGSTFIRWLGNL